MNAAIEILEYNRDKVWQSIQTTEQELQKAHNTLTYLTNVLNDYKREHADYVMAIAALKERLTCNPSS